MSGVFMCAGRKVTVASGLRLHRLLQLHVSQIGHVTRVRMMRMGFEGMVRKRWLVIVVSLSVVVVVVELKIMYMMVMML
mgnify:CR=1 FL=1